MVGNFICEFVQRPRDEKLCPLATNGMDVSKGEKMVHTLVYVTCSIISACVHILTPQEIKTKLLLFIHLSLRSTLS